MAKNARKAGLFYSLLLCVWLTTITETSAQKYFNQRFTCKSSASVCHNLIAYGDDGQFIMTGNAYDSSSGGAMGMFFERLDKDGKTLKHGFFPIPNYPAWWCFTSERAITKINDNRYVIAGTIEKRGCCKSGFLVEIDSNCEPKFFKEIFIPFTSTDSLMYLADVKYDGNGGLVLVSHVQTDSPKTLQMVQKFDTSYKEIWHKEFTEFGSYDRRTSNGMLIEDDGYTFYGGASAGTVRRANYYSHSTIFKTDTAGTLLWSYEDTSDGNRTSTIYKAIKTQDGGYLFLRDGHTINLYPFSTTIINLTAKNQLVKLDALRNTQWTVDLDSHYMGWLELDYQGLIELPDKSIIVQRWDADSVDLNNKYVGFQKFSKDGISIWRRRLPIPSPLKPDFSELHLNDFIKLSNGDLLAGGSADNYALPPDGPLERAWLVKVDSVGCMGASDPCTSVAISEQTPVLRIVNIFPNPTEGDFMISGRLDVPSTFQLCDLAGKLIRQIELPAGDIQHNFSTNSMPPATYIYKISGTAILPIYGKLIKQ